MKRLLAIFVVIVAVFFCGCNDGELPELPAGAETIDGVYISEELDVGYLFTKDGFGMMNVAGEPFQIVYYILDGNIYVQNFSVEDEGFRAFSFEQYDDHVLISGIKYKLSVEAKDEIPSY